MATAITIASTDIRQDPQGRYCLNDLHKASGGEKKHQPSDWLSTQAAASLIQELWAETPGWVGSGPVPLIPGIPGVGPYESTPGRYGGTYVVKELVYAYAMWISAKFHLQVIRAYDQLVTAPALPAFKAPASLREALLLALAQEEQIEALSVANVALEYQATQDAPKVGVYEAVVAGKHMFLAQFGKMLAGLNTLALPGDMLKLGYFVRDSKGYRPRAPYRDSHFHYAVDDQYGKTAIEVLPKGKELITRLWAEGRLTMRVGFPKANA